MTSLYSDTKCSQKSYNKKLKIYLCKSFDWVGRNLMKIKFADFVFAYCRITTTFHKLWTNVIAYHSVLFSFYLALLIIILLFSTNICYIMNCQYLCIIWYLNFVKSCTVIVNVTFSAYIYLYIFIVSWITRIYLYRGVF